MKYMVMAQLVILSSVAFGGDKPAICELSNKSVVSRSSSGLAQVSNLGLILIECRVPARLVPIEPGQARYPPKVGTVTYQISTDGSRTLVPSEVNQTGSGYDMESESVDFDAHIPLEPAKRDDEARRFLAKLEEFMAPQQLTDEAHQRALERAREIVSQQCVGHFQVECRILDGDRVIGVGVVELEVLFKGRFSDFGLPASPPI